MAVPISIKKAATETFRKRNEKDDKRDRYRQGSYRSLAGGWWIGPIHRPENRRAPDADAGRPRQLSSKHTHRP
jgi:hypothetical protein